MLYSAEFWVLVAFAMFIAIIVYVGGVTKILDALDARGKRIQAELDEAKRLREEASRVLADYQRRRGEAEGEAQAIVAAARDEAERVAREAQERMSDFVTRRTAAAEAKIAQAETAAMQQVRAAAADTAIRASEAILREEMRGDAGQDLLSRSLAEVRGKLHS
jgi:F-type H+-transporting ATPase subunit b